MENRWKYEVVDINLIDEAELNANEMSSEDFAQLCDNIGKSGLSSVPCCYKKENGRFGMISGHHRLRACKKLFHSTIGILYCDESELSKDEIIAIQLSHNSLHGQDNQSILKKLFEQIQSIDFKKFAHVNVDEVQPISMDGIDIFAYQDNFTFSVILYPNSFESLDTLLGDIREQAKKSDAIILAEDDNEFLFVKLQKEVGKEYNITSPITSFAKILELAAERLQQIQNGDDLGGSN